MAYNSYTNWKSSPVPISIYNEPGPGWWERWGKGALITGLLALGYGLAVGIFVGGILYAASVS
jgi:hypothetical protein